MFGPLFAAAAGLSLLVVFVFKPLSDYFRDPKGLRKYPNLSPLAGITNLAFIWESNKGFRSAALLEAHKKAPVVRIGPNSLSYGDLRAIKDIYGHGTKCTKDIFYSTLAGSHFHLADVIDKPEHARKRKVLSSAYALKNLEGWEHKVADKTTRLIAQFDKRCTTSLPTGQRPSPSDLTVDYRMWSNFFTIDAIADIGLSERTGLLDRNSDLVTAQRMDGTVHKAHYRQCLHSTARAQSGIVWSYAWYPTLQRLTSLISPSYRSWWKLNESWNDIVYHRATQRLKRYQAGEKLDDFFTALMEDKNGAPNSLEWGEIVAEISIMMNAGSDTTAIAMNNALFMLLKNPSALAKLRAELSTITSPSTDVVLAYDKVKHLPYLRACLDESMRIYPPTTFGLPRRTPAEGAPILGDYIAGETTVSMSSYIAHRDPTIFPEPETFRPERWLEDGAKELQPYFITFSAGARGCIGRNISYLEQTVLLSSIINRYEFALESPDWEPTRWESMNLAPGPMPLKVWRREEEEKLEM